MYAKVEAALRAILRTDPTWGQTEELTCRNLMVAVCLKGRLDILEQLRKELHWTSTTEIVTNLLKDHSQSQVQQIFSTMLPRIRAVERYGLVAMLCRNDEFQLILLLGESYELTAADVRHEQACRMLEHACWNGNLDLAVWLANRFEFQTEDVVMRLGDVCARGHAHIMRWLTDRFRLTAAHIRACGVLLHACCSGDLDFARWMVGRFGLTVRDARKNHHRLLWHLCISGQARVTAWIMGHFGLGMPGSRLSLTVMTRYTAQNVASDEHYLCAIRWIEQTQAIRLRPRESHHFMEDALDKRHLNRIRWIAHRHGLLQKDIARPAWVDRRWLKVMDKAVWTEAGEVAAVQWPKEMA